MKKFILLLSLFASILYLVNSCTPEKDPICIRKGIGTINEPAIFPDTVAFGDTVIGMFKVTGNNGCSKFDGFYDVYYRDFLIPQEIYVPAPHIIDEGCVCTEIAPVFDVTYSYVPYDTGMFFVSYTIYGDILQHDTVYVY